MKLLISFLFIGLASFTFAQQQQGVKIAPKRASVREPIKKEMKVLPTTEMPAPAPGVNNATDSNRKRPGGTINNQTNSKNAPASGGNQTGKKD